MGCYHLISTLHSLGFQLQLSVRKVSTSAWALPNEKLFFHRARNLTSGSEKLLLEVGKGTNPEEFDKERRGLRANRRTLRSLQLITDDGGLRLELWRKRGYVIAEKILLVIKVVQSTLFMRLA